MAENELAMGPILTARAEEDRLKLWRILGVHASLESWQLEVLVILISIWIVEARLGRLRVRLGYCYCSFVEKSSLGSSRYVQGRKKARYGRGRARGCATASMSQLWHFQLCFFVPRDSSVKVVTAMEAQDDLQRRIHFRHFVAAHQEIQIRIVGKRSAIPHYRISFYCRSHLTHSLTASTTKTTHCAYPIRSRNTHMNIVLNIRSAGVLEM